MNAEAPEAIIPESFFKVSLPTPALKGGLGKVAPTHDGILASERQSGSRRTETWQCRLWIICAIFGRFSACLLMR